MLETIIDTTQCNMVHERDFFPVDLCNTHADP